MPPHPKTIKESDKNYLKFSQLPGLALGEVEKFKEVHGFDGLVQSLEVRTILMRDVLRRLFGTGVRSRSWAAHSGVSYPV